MFHFLPSFLHNIYYDYISNNNLYALKPNKYTKNKISYFTGDARLSINKLSNKYDIVFLDAFSPQKSLSLWTIDFLAGIKNKIKKDGVIISYSKSTPFRSALIELRFYTGKTYIQNKDMGTIASLNPGNILNPLSDFDLNLIKTSSGIVYKDFSLNTPDEIILKSREIEMKNSNRLSHTKFLKMYNIMNI